MNDSIAHINLSKIHADIDQAKADIEAAQKRLDVLLAAKGYIDSIQQAPTVFALKSDIKIKIKPPLKVSDFILSYLKRNGFSSTAAIIESFAEHTGQKYKDAQGNVSNALSRLKKANEIESAERPGGRKAGYNWRVVMPDERPKNGVQSLALHEQEPDEYDDDNN